VVEVRFVCDFGGDFMICVVVFDCGINLLWLLIVDFDVEVGMFMDFVCEMCIVWLG